MIAQSQHHLMSGRHLHVFDQSCTFPYQDRPSIITFATAPGTYTQLIRSMGCLQPQQLTIAATNALASEDPLNSTLSAQISSLLNTLSTDVSEFLDAIVAQAPQVEANETTRAILVNFLRNNAAATVNYATVLAGIVSEDQAATVSSMAAELKAAYSGVLGEICIGSTAVLCETLGQGGF